MSGEDYPLILAGDTKKVKHIALKGIPMTKEIPIGV